MGSILNDVKKTLSLPPEIKEFDQDIILHTNSVFSTLTQLGVGPDKGFMITDEKPEWDAFFTDIRLNEVKSYVYLRVRMLFDPPTVGVLVNAFESQIKELEWRLNLKGEEMAESWDDQTRLF